VYLSRKLSSMDEDAPDVHKKLVKAHQMWAQASHVLLHEKATRSTIKMFYKAVAQTVLLFGSETWVVTPSMMNTSESFHQQVAHRNSGRSPVYL
jgi:tRNA(Leu) C34 or U34 (ribose-2'-O)-methylase TrmL